MYGHLASFSIKESEEDYRAEKESPIIPFSFGYLFIVIQYFRVISYLNRLIISCMSLNDSNNTREKNLHTHYHFISHVMFTWVTRDNPKKRGGELEAQQILWRTAILIGYLCQKNICHEMIMSTWHGNAHMDDTTSIIHIVTDGDSKSQSSSGGEIEVDDINFLGPMNVLLSDSWHLTQVKGVTIELAM